MQSGDIFRWSNFPDPKYNTDDIKPRWFVYLGDTGKLRTPVIVYLLTATTNLASTEPGGVKHGHSVCRYHPNSSPFDLECIIDVDEGAYTVDPGTLAGNPDIEIKGSLTEQQMRELYNKLVRSQHYNKFVLRDIHRSFNDAGISSLKMP